MEPKIWKPINGYEGVYLVSNYGEVKRIIYKGNQCNILLKTKVKNSGYIEVGLRDKENNKKSFLVHRLVAIAFVANPEKKKQVNHKDTDKKNNFYKNLEWNTPKENIIHSWVNGRSKPNVVKGEKNGKSKLSSIQVEKIKSMILTQTAEIISKEFSVSKSCIYAIKYKRTWK